MGGKGKRSKIIWKLSMESAAELRVVTQVYFSGMETVLCLVMYDLSRQGRFFPPIFCSPALDPSPFQQVLAECNSC